MFFKRLTFKAYHPTITEFENFSSDTFNHVGQTIVWKKDKFGKIIEVSNIEGGMTRGEKGKPMKFQF